MTTKLIPVQVIACRNCIVKNEGEDTAWFSSKEEALAYARGRATKPKNTD